MPARIQPVRLTWFVINDRKLYESATKQMSQPNMLYCSTATCPRALVREERNSLLGPSVRPVSMDAKPNGASSKYVLGVQSTPYLNVIAMGCRPGGPYYGFVLSSGHRRPAAATAIPVPPEPCCHCQQCQLILAWRPPTAYCHAHACMLAPTCGCGYII